MPAKAATALRCYFYYLNERGNLFHVFDVKGLLTGHRTPSGPTFLTDAKFQDFFFRRMEYNHVGHVNAIAAAASPGDTQARKGLIASRGTATTPAHLHTSSFLFSPRGPLEDGTVLSPYQLLLHFPFVSPCGAELNFVKVQDGVPVVFTALDFLPPAEDVAGPGEATAPRGKPVRGHSGSTGSSSSSHHTRAELSFAGTLREPFDGDSVVVSRDGKMFHALTSLHRFRREAAKTASAAAHEARLQQLMDCLGEGGAVTDREGGEDEKAEKDRFTGWEGGEGNHPSPAPHKPRQDPTLLSSVDIAQSKPIREKLLHLSRCVQPSATDTTTTTVPNPACVSEIEGLLRHVTRPPKGLLGATIGLKLGFDFMDEERDEEGRYTMEWNGERKVLPFF